MTTTLHDVFGRVSWSEVAFALRRHYPEDARDLASHRRAFETMTALVPDKTDYWLCSEIQEPDEDDPRRVAVRCTNGTRNERSGEEMRFGLDFRRWPECLGMEVPVDLRDTFTDADIVAHCLWEMTWHGIDEGDGQAFLDELKERYSEPRSKWLTREEFRKLWDLE